MSFNLGDAVNNQAGPWPDQPNQPGWPGGNSIWPGGNQPTPVWQGGNQPTPVWQGGGGGGGGGGGSNPNPAWNPQPSVPGGWSNPSQPSGPGGWSNPGPGPGPAPNVSPQQNLKVPYDLSLPHGVYEKLLIRIAGTVKSGANKFTVDFYTGSGDLAFHFNPRFNDDGQKVIVRNTCVSKKWGKEERELSRFPFVQGQAFEIMILCTNTEFKVAVNNSHLLEYRHRLTDLRNIKQVSIYNDITLSRVTTETAP